MQITWLANRIVRFHYRFLGQSATFLCPFIGLLHTEQLGLALVEFPLSTAGTSCGTSGTRKQRDKIICKLHDMCQLMELATVLQPCLFTIDGKYFTENCQLGIWAILEMPVVSVLN